jgi:hypothetical protein
VPARCRRKPALSAAERGSALFLSIFQMTRCAFLGIYLADFRFAGRLRKGISNVGPLANFHLQASLMRAFHFDRPGRKG